MRARGNLGASMLLVGLTFLSSCVEKPKVPEDLPVGRFVLHWQVPEQKVELGVPHRMFLWMCVEDGIDAEPPRVERAYRDLEAVRMDAVGPGHWSERDGDRVWARIFQVQWLRLGKQTLPPLTHRVKKGHETLEASTLELEFDVVGKLPDDADPAAEIPSGLIEDPPPPSPWPWVIGAAALLALGALIYYLRGRGQSRERIPTVRPLPPHQIALDRLKRIERSLSEGQIGGEQLVVEVSEVLRRFIEDGLHIRVLARTSEEFLEAARSGMLLPAEMQSSVQRFLTQCDLVKFAAQHPSLELCHELIRTAREFIAATRHREEGLRHREEGQPAVAAVGEEAGHG